MYVDHILRVICQHTTTTHTHIIYIHTHIERSIELYDPLLQQKPEQSVSTRVVERMKRNTFSLS